MVQFSGLRWPYLLSCRCQLCCVRYDSSATCSGTERPESFFWAMHPLCWTPLPTRFSTSLVGLFPLLIMVLLFWLLQITVKCTVYPLIFWYFCFRSNFILHNFSLYRRFLPPFFFSFFGSKTSLFYIFKGFIYDECTLVKWLLVNTTLDPKASKWRPL